MGRRVLSPPDKSLGKRRELPQRGPKMDLCISEVRKKPSGTPFSVFLSDGGAPKTSRGPGKLPLALSPRSTRLADTVGLCIITRIFSAPCMGAAAIILR